MIIHDPPKKVFFKNRALFIIRLSHMSIDPLRENLAVFMKGIRMFIFQIESDRGTGTGGADGLLNHKAA